MQLILKLGFAEYDDLFDNILGAAIGAVFVLIFIKFVREVEMFKGKNGIYNRFFKRLIDIICALLALIVFWWLYAIVAILVRIKLGSPIIFKQARPGKINPKTGKETTFYLYKFRSMTDAKDKDDKFLPDDMRLTKFGRLLRYTSMDELPEAINILKGDMSIIGDGGIIETTRKNLDFTQVWMLELSLVMKLLCDLGSFKSQNLKSRGLLGYA